jgi:site-specific DNA recombinase
VQAVIYCRVSSHEQLKNLSLETQTQACVEFCRANGLEVTEIFVERGESARSADRTELQRMLTYCRKRKGHVQFLVVYMLDRFARNQYDHHALKAYLMKLGITLRAVAQPIDDSATGQLMDGILAAFSEFDNNLRRDRTLTGMKAAAEKGRWTFPTPLGYRKAFKADGTKTIEPDPEVAPLIRKAFELGASGLHELVDIFDEMRVRGLRGRRGSVISKTMLHKILHNPIYYGGVRVQTWDLDTQGDFEPLIDEDTFARTQLHLSETRPTITAYRRNHPDFPLRRFVRCGVCDRPLTGAWSRGKTSSYPYYNCAGCKGLNVRKAVLEERFVQLLDELRPKAEVLELLSAAVLDRWNVEQKDVVERRRAIERRIEELRRRKERIVEAYLYENALDKETYQRHMGRVEEDLTLAELDLYDVKVDEFDIEGTLAFAGHLVSHASRLWIEADLDQRQRMQKVFFPEGLSFDGKEFRTPLTCPFFSNFEGISGARERLVARRGFEPLLPA